MKTESGPTPWPLMYTRIDITLDDRQEIFSRYWRFGDDYGTVSRLAEEFRTSRTSDNVATWRANNCLHFG